MTIWPSVVATLYRRHGREGRAPVASMPMTLRVEHRPHPAPHDAAPSREALPFIASMAYPRLRRDIAGISTQQLLALRKLSWARCHPAQSTAEVKYWKEPLENRAVVSRYTSTGMHICAQKRHPHEHRPHLSCSIYNRHSNKAYFSTPMCRAWKQMRLLFHFSRTYAPIRAHIEAFVAQ